MNNNKRFTTARKLDSLPVKSKITFGNGDTYSQKWEKLPNGKWKLPGNTFSNLHPYTAHKLIEYMQGQSFLVISN